MNTANNPGAPGVQWHGNASTSAPGPGAAAPQGMNPYAFVPFPQFAPNPLNEVVRAVCMLREGPCGREKSSGRALKERAGRYGVEAGPSGAAWRSRSTRGTLSASRIHEVPLLHDIFLVEGKVNTFIHCYVAARKIVTVYDLEVEPCKNEGIGKFEELGLGPFLQHPLVVHYFSAAADFSMVPKLSSEEIINFLQKFMDNSKMKITVEDFLNYLVEQLSIPGKQTFSVCLQGLGVPAAVMERRMRGPHGGCPPRGTTSTRAAATASGSASGQRQCASSPLASRTAHVMQPSSQKGIVGVVAGGQRRHRNRGQGGNLIQAE